MIGNQPARGASSAVGNGLAAAERLLAKLRHDPAASAATVGAPVVLVVIFGHIFGHIFGSAISVPGGGNPAGPANGAWPLEHPVTASLAWTALLLVVFVPLCTARHE